MGGVTAGGWPYVSPTDYPKEFPTHSQALANKLESRLGHDRVQGGTVLTDASGLATVTFPAAFTAQPTVVCTTAGGVGIVGITTPVTATGFGVTVLGHAGAPYPGVYVSWLAVGLVSA